MDSKLREPKPDEPAPRPDREARPNATPAAKNGGNHDTGSRAAGDGSSGVAAHPGSGSTRPSAVFATQMRLQREKKGMTQRQLAGRLGDLGFEVHQTTIGKWEAGERRISLDEALAICAALDVAPTHMLSGSFLPVRMKRPFLVLSDDTRPVSAREMRQWIRGQRPLWGQDEKRYATEVAPDEWKALGVAGLAELLRGVEGLVNAWADDDIDAALEIIESLEDEIGRQRRALERDGRSREDGHVPSRLSLKR